MRRITDVLIRGLMLANASLLIFIAVGLLAGCDENPVKPNYKHCTLEIRDKVETTRVTAEGYYIDTDATWGSEGLCMSVMRGTSAVATVCGQRVIGWCEDVEEEKEPQAEVCKKVCQEARQGYFSCTCDNTDFGRVR